MDDLKLYAKKQHELNSLIHATVVFSNDIGMNFGLEKCGGLIIERGNIRYTSGIDVRDGLIRDIDVQQGYKYLGILQAQLTMHPEAKENATSIYKHRMKKVLKSKLNGASKIQAVNAYALPVLTYTAGIVKWTKDELN
jgi:formylmethanofuran dehydrogenase subunit C